MIHQLVTANYYHLTAGARERRPLRAQPVPGSHYVKTTQPGFRWNVVDYGVGNVFADPLNTGKRCAGTRSAWHCLWQRFPQQAVTVAAPPPESPLGMAAEYLYNISLNGESKAQLLQYMVIAGVANVFSTPTEHTRTYIRDRVRTVCHRGGPHCGGSADELSTPVAAVHVRHGDSCDRTRDEQGPFNSMFAWDAKKGKNERVGFRYCYTWRVYLQQLREMQRRYGVRTVLLATDDAKGEVIERLGKETEFNWVYLDFPRGQFQKRGWMEFRHDLDENAPFSIVAALELLSAADVFVGNMGSHVSRMVYNKMVASSATSVLPPFISVDGYGMCCDFTEECAKQDIRKRRRDTRQCIYKYGTCTGGDQWFFHRG